MFLCPYRDGRLPHTPAYMVPGSGNLERVWCLYCQIPMKATDDGWEPRSKYKPEPAPEGEE